MDTVGELVSEFIKIQKENLFIVAEVRKGGRVPESHRDYLEYLELAVSSLNKTANLEIVN